LRHRDFRRYLAGVVVSQIGTEGTFAVMLYHVYQITGSTVQTGLVGGAQGLAVFLLSPLGGYCADRMDRKRLLQIAQATSLISSLALAIVTLSGEVKAWHVLLAALVNTAALTFDRPVRKAIIPAMIPRDELVQGFSLMNPAGEVSRLVGPGVGGLLVAAGGPGLVYLLDSITFLGLIVVVASLRIPHTPPSATAMRIWSSLIEGVRFVRNRPLIIQLMSLDLSAMIFPAYRVVLPAIAIDVLLVGPTGYGMLAAAVPVGALIGGVIVYRLANMSAPAGRVVIGSTIAYGLAAILLAQSRTFPLALAAAGLLGFFNAVTTVLRHAAVLLVTPDPLLGRVSALYGMSAGGGPALGDLQMGWLSRALGVSLALSLGGLVPIVWAILVGLTSGTVRDFRTNDRPTA
jgi:MFS family permease